MKILIAILSIILCLWSECHHNSIRQYAEINIPSYMRSSEIMVLYTVLCYLTTALSFVATCNMAWYWSVLVSIPTHLFLFMAFTVFYEKITDANYSFVSGGSGFQIWVKLIVAMILSVVAALL